ncbi:curli production assembly/transport component CsgF [Methylobacterium gregans]
MGTLAKRPGTRVQTMITRIVAAIAALTLSGTAGLAGNLVYQPVNPAFGGSPLNGSWLQADAQAQNIPQAADQRRQQVFNAVNQAATSRTLTPGQIFAQQLQSQLFSSLANQITQSIFGENARPNGTFTFQGTTIDFVRIGSDVRVTINDGQTITQVVVPAAPSAAFIRRLSKRRDRIRNARGAVPWRSFHTRET